VETGEDGHRPRAASTDDHQQPARAPGDVPAGEVAQLLPDQPRAGPQADKRGCAHPPRNGRLRASQPKVAGDLQLAVGRLRSLAGQRHRRRLRVRVDRARERPEIGPERAARRRRYRARALHDEPLDRRRVQQHPGRELEPGPLAEAGER
jgi:hypothetical protein